MKHRASIAAYSKEAHVSLHRLKAISESQYFINPGEEIVDVPSALTFLAEEVHTQCMPSVRRSHNGLKYSIVIKNKIGIDINIEILIAVRNQLSTAVPARYVLIKV